MEKTEILKKYLQDLVRFCNVSDICRTRSAIYADAEDISLPGVFVKPLIIHKNDHDREESGKKNEIEETDKEMSVWIEKLIEENEKVYDEYMDYLAENGLEEDEYVEEDPEQYPDVNWYYGTSGSGKTTLLKMYAFAYAYRFYTGTFGQDDLFPDTSVAEVICRNLNVTSSGIPVFIRASDLRRNCFSGDVNGCSLDDILSSAVTIDMGHVSKEEEQELFDILKTGNALFFVDDVEELNNREIRLLLTVLQGGKQANCFMASGFRLNLSDNCIYPYRVHMIAGRNVRPEEEDFIIPGLSEYVIKGIDTESEEVIQSYTEKLCSAFKVRNEEAKRISLELKETSELKDVVTSPLELTMLMIESLYQRDISFKPLDIYKHFFELRIEWNSVYHYPDVMLQLSQIAYRTASSENDMTVLESDKLSQLLKAIRMEAKTELNEQKSRAVDEVSIREFTEYLYENRFLKKNGCGYEFMSGTIRDYLAASCIIFDRFPYGSEKENRIDYVKDFISAHHGKHHQIVIFTALCKEMREDVVSYLFELADNSEDRLTATYCLSILITLSGYKDEAFDDNNGIDAEELNRLFETLTGSLFGIGIARAFREWIGKIFETRGHDARKLFIGKAVSQLSSLKGIEADMYKKLFLECEFIKGL